MKSVHYEPHPVSPERKAELMAQGVRIVDARFAPDDAVAPSAPPDLTREGVAAMDKADLLDLLDAHGWDGDKRLGVERLREALTEIMFVGL